VERERALVAELRGLDAATLAARESGAHVLPGSERRERLAAELDETWATIDAPDYVAARRGDALDILGIREVVFGGRPGTTVLSLFLLEDQTALFHADRGGFGVQRVPVGRGAWRDALRRFQRELPGSFGEDLLPPTWEAPLRPLLDAASAHADGASEVVLVPHGEAHALPWGYLAREWPGRPAVTTVPSLGILARLRMRPPAASEGAFVAGNPTGDLPDAEAEAVAVGEALGVDAVLGPSATTDALDTAAPDARTVHLACHAAFDTNSPLDSHVLLSDGHWSARHALGGHLDADLVVLSACETGRYGALAGDEVAGLAQAFLYAGARAVVVSLWRVSDAAAADFMRVFHEIHSSGGARAAAMQRAAEAVRAEREHPWYWAAFALVGDN
jgi:hypothetical protein